LDQFCSFFLLPLFPLSPRAFDVRGMAGLRQSFARFQMESGFPPPHRVTDFLVSRATSCFQLCQAKRGTVSRLFSDRIPIPFTQFLLLSRGRNPGPPSSPFGRQGRGIFVPWSRRHVVTPPTILAPDGEASVPLQFENWGSFSFFP